MSKQAKSKRAIIQSIVKNIEWWEGQNEDDLRYLNCIPQLQQLRSIDKLQFELICRSIEDSIFTSDNLEQLAKTAYDCMITIGYDCSSFEWVNS